MTPFLDLPGATVADGAIRLPGSKSITLRALLLAALSRGDTVLDGVLESDDSRVMLDALRALGIEWEKTGADTIRIRGGDGPFPVKRAAIFVGNSGVSTRSLVAALAFSNGHYEVDGVPRMRERPINDLVDGLRQVNADVRYAGADGFPPLHIAPATIDVTRPVRVRGDVSSQFLTGILQALPLTGKPAIVHVVGELISAPYIEITLNLMERFGVKATRNGWSDFSLPGDVTYTSPGRYRIEGDASGASYFLAAGAIAGSRGQGSAARPRVRV